MWGEILNRHDTCSLKIVIFKLSSSPDSDLIIAKGNDLIQTNYVQETEISNAEIDKYQIATKHLIQGLLVQSKA